MKCVLEAIHLRKAELGLESRLPTHKPSSFYYEHLPILCIFLGL